MQDKEALRKQILRQRASIPKQEVVAKSNIMWQFLKDLPEFKEAKMIMSYISFGGEVYTHEMINSTIGLTKKVVVPFVDKKKDKIVPMHFPGWRNLGKNEGGILEPKTGFKNPVKPAKVDLFVIPGLAFDNYANRLGFGKGYYDKLLKENKKAKRIALAFEYQVVPEVPITPRDVKVEKIVTEKRVIVGK